MTRLESTDLGQYLYRGSLFLGYFRNHGEALIAFEIAELLTDEQVKQAIANADAKADAKLREAQANLRRAA